MTATILVADDDRAIRLVLSQALGQLGHNVRAAGDAATLWSWVERGDGDVVITDVVMPDENGLDLIPRIKSHRPDLPIIVMSAQNTLLTAIRATERGAFEYLPKPFDLRALIATVERALNQTGQPDPDLTPSFMANPVPARNWLPASSMISVAVKRCRLSPLTWPQSRVT